MEKAGLVLAAVFIALGVGSILHPTEGYLFHPSSGWPPDGIIGRPNPAAEHVTQKSARITEFSPFA
jgi:hypothetical protein